ERTFPASWILPNGCDVSDEFVRYAQPLVGEDMLSLPMIGGRQRMTQFKPIFAEKKLTPYIPEADRKKIS
ncbi:MAG: 6-phosphofructokinase, partial [Planctomycetaceae bacterium]|nr:6-phosphofructokinase [Planctomycetaceae bacterium]